MSTLGDLLRAVRETIVMDERVRALASRVDRIDAQLMDTRERLLVIETLFAVLARQGTLPKLGQN